MIRLLEALRQGSPYENKWVWQARVRAQVWEAVTFGEFVC